MPDQNEFQSSEIFDDAQLDALDAPKDTEHQLVESEFNKQRDELLGLESVKEENKPWTISEDDFKAIVEKANGFDAYKVETQGKLDRAFGTIGQMQDDLKKFREQPQGQPIKLTKERFARLSELFGDDTVAEALAEDLGELTMQGQSSQFDVEAFNVDQDTRWTARETNLRADIHKDLLTAIHPDWKDITMKRGPDGNPMTGDDGRIVHTDDFAAWHKSLSTEAQKKVLSANDAPTLIKVLNEFKTWNGKKSEFERKKQQRLEDNLPISGGMSGRNAPNQTKSAFDIEKQRLLASRS